MGDRAGRRGTTTAAARRAAAAAAVAAALLGTAACTTPQADPDRAGTVVVAVDAPFRSLNAATVDGRAPGSVLVRGLVQSGFVALEPDGSVTPDPSFGTVEKVADDPLTVRYTIASTATWSDGVPVTPADLLLEWAARSGQLDEVVPELGADGRPADPGALDDVVAFGATSPVLVHASAVPAVDGSTLTLVYDRPVADWQLALDVNLPAHVVGRLALDPAAATTAAPTSGATSTATPAPTATATPEPTATAATPEPTATPQDPAAWAGAVAAAVQQQDRAALLAISRVWRTAGSGRDVGADPTLTTTTGPYVLARVGEDGVEAVRNEEYAGERPARWERVQVRTDLAPLAQVDAVEAGDVDVAAPLSTADVLAAAEDADAVTTRTDGDAVLQLVLQERGGGLFDPAGHPDAPDPAAAAGALRAAFLAAVPRDDLVAQAVRPLWAQAEPSDVVAAAVGPLAPGADVDAAVPAATAGVARGDDGTVRLLTATGDPVRAAAADVVTEAAAEAGLDVVLVDADDPAALLRDEPDAWDAALVPAVQGDLPVASLVSRWRSDGATNASGPADPALDAALDALAGTADTAALPGLVSRASDALVVSGAVLPLVRLPAATLVADRPAQEDVGLPRVAGVGVLATSRADLTSWWDWARADGE